MGNLDRGFNCSLINDWYRNKMIEISVGGGSELQGPEADVVQGLVVDAEGLVGVLDQLMDRQGGVVRLDDGVGNLISKRLFYNIN